MTYSVVFSPKAQLDLRRLYDYIAERDGHDRAFGYITRIEAACRKLDTLPMRGSSHDEIRPGLRLVGFERRVSIAFEVEPKTVTILRVLYGGRDLGKAFRKQ